MKNHILILFLSATIISCGKKGDPGVQGPPGNANVHSYGFTVTPGLWQTNGTVGIDYEKFVNFSVPSINQNILTNGVVIVYLIDDLAPNYNGQLPISYPAGITTVNILPSVYLGIASIEYQLGNYNVPNITSNYYFKVSVIEGSVVLTHPEINWNDAKAISKGLNLN